MLSNFSANSCCSKKYFARKHSLTSYDSVLETIEEESVLMDEPHPSLKDMEISLEETKPANLVASDTCLLPKPPSRSDSISMMHDGHRKHQLQHGQSSRFGSRRRLETYLGEETVKAYREELDREEMRHESDKSYAANTATVSNNNSGPPIVWDIHPCHGKDNTLQFKISADGGSYLILKGYEALEVIKESPQNTFFQVYALEGGVSHAANANRISEVMEDILYPQSTWNEEDIPTSSLENKHTVKSRIFQRLARNIFRRRWNNLVGRQVAVAVGDSRKRRRKLTALSPLFMVWKMLTRRYRTF